MQGLSEFKERPPHEDARATSSFQLNAPRASPSLNPASLADLEPGTTVQVKARLVSFSYSQRRDRMGEKTVLNGTIEDKAFRIPLMSHRIFDLESGKVYLFKSAFVHEFPDSSIALILTEYSKVEEKPGENPSSYAWRPMIGNIERPAWSVSLSGIVTRIFPSSGLVKRCNGCLKVIYGDKCAKGCASEWSWDLRISCLLSDHTGSIRTLIARHMAARLLGRNVSEIMYVANSPGKRLELDGASGTISYKLGLPEKLEVKEIIVENASRLRAFEKLLITDGFNTAYSPIDSPLTIGQNEESSIRELDWKKDPQDFKIARKVIEKALEIKIVCQTKCPLVNGIFLLDSPQNLYDCEKAKLNIGFRKSLMLRGSDVILDIFTEARIQESVWDFVRWRRGTGASANAIEDYLVSRRSTVKIAPSGKLGIIKGILWYEAGKSPASDSDKRTFVEYWKDVYGADVSQEEIPLLRIQPADSSSVFTYPPSKVYFDESALPVTHALKKLLSRKKAEALDRARKIIESALSDFKIGSLEVACTPNSDSPSDVHHELLSETQRALFGKNLKARGQVVKYRDEMFFLPESSIEVN
jgi:hypothetical protein